MTYLICAQKVRDRLNARIREPVIINCASAALILLLSSFARAESLPLRTYTVADGLGHNTINKIVRDSRGFLWFCTNEGLSRFDGYSFTNYDTNDGLPHRVVNDFLQTRDGELWFGTNGGLVHFNPRGVPNSQDSKVSNANQRFTVILPESDDRNAKAISVLLQGRDGTIWCGTLHGLYRLDSTDGRFVLHPVDLKMTTTTPEQSFVLDLLEDRNGSLWVAAPSGLYRRWVDGSVARYTPQEGLPSLYLHDLFEDSRGQMWAATRDAGFFQFVADERHTPPVVMHAYQKWDGLTKWVYQIFETSDHRYWVATNSGLAEFFPDSGNTQGQFQSYSTKNGLAYSEITALNEDMSGNLWMGSYAGAMKLARDGFVTYGEQEGLVLVSGIFEDRTNGLCFRGYVKIRESNNVVTGTGRSRGEYGCFDGQRFTWFMPSVPKTHNFGWVGEGVTLHARNGEWWLGTGEGLYRFPPADDFIQIKNARPLSIYQTKEGLVGFEQVFRIFEDSRGDIWSSTIAARNGLARWERATDTLVRELADWPQLPPPETDLAHSFGEDASGNVWIGFSTGLARYHDGKFSFFNAKDGLPEGTIQNIHSDGRGRLWLASSRSGLIRVDDPEARNPSFTTVQGLSSNSAVVITEDSNGRIYVGTGRGLDRLDPETGRVNHFTAADGLAGGDLLAAFRDRNGLLWFGTAKGLSRFSPIAERKSVEPPPILINSLRVAGELRPVSAQGETEIVLPDLAPDHNQLQIDFVGLSFASGEVLRYQYQVEGADKDWGAPTTNRTISYARLAPGHYKFSVRAITSDGIMSRVPATVSFTILLPVWQRWWFVTIIATMVGLIFYSLYRYRLARLVELERVRMRIAADLHDDIGSSLSQISVLSEVLRKQLGAQVPPASKNLSLINRVSHEALDSMSDIVWAINPSQDHLSDLVRRMRRLTSEVLPTRDIEFTFKAPSSGPDLKVGADIRREIFLMFKEAVNNMVRHSGCTRAQIDLKVEGAWCELSVADNGKGFDLSQPREGNGLVSLHRRAESLGGDCIVSSNGGKGTVVTIKVPHNRSRVSRAGKGRAT